jgi:transcriptional regulator with XRE-family HTH domain
MSLRRIQEYQRQALNYRIQRGTMTVKLLSAKTGLSSSHLSLFLHGRKRLSIEAMDRVLVVQGLAVEVLPIQKT